MLANMKTLWAIFLAGALIVLMIVVLYRLGCYLWDWFRGIPHNVISQDFETEAKQRVRRKTGGKKS
jgi:hypothetical protein